jgi:serine/threonine protein kinase
MHANSAVHKDLKLENVVVDAGNGIDYARGWTPRSVKIIDFDTVEEWNPKTPKAKQVLGTDQYIAQEAYDGSYSPCSDIFALGVIMYKLAAGRFPFREDLFDDKPGENWVGSPKMSEIRGRLKNVKIDWNKDCFCKNPSLAELCAKMLSYDELSRPTAADCLQSAFFCPGAPNISSGVSDKSTGIDSNESISLQKLDKWMTTQPNGWLAEQIPEKQLLERPEPGKENRCSSPGMMGNLHKLFKKTSEVVCGNSDSESPKKQPSGVIATLKTRFSTPSRKRNSNPTTYPEQVRGA